MEVEELCAVGLVLVMMSRMLVLRRNGERRHRRVPRWWMRPWIKDRLLEGQLNTAYKLQRQLAYVSIIIFAPVAMIFHVKEQEFLAGNSVRPDQIIMIASSKLKNNKTMKIGKEKNKKIRNADQ